MISLHRPDYLAASHVLGNILVMFVLTGSAAKVSAQIPDGPQNSSSAVTEIWMSGEDFAVSRKVDRHDPAASDSTDEIARTMMDLAKQRYAEFDRMEAEWLMQWAKKLSSGRIGDWELFEQDWVLTEEATTSPDRTDAQHEAPDLQSPHETLTVTDAVPIYAQFGPSVGSRSGTSAVSEDGDHSGALAEHLRGAHRRADSDQVLSFEDALVLATTPPWHGPGLGDQRVARITPSTHSTNSANRSRQNESPAKVETTNHATDAPFASGPAATDPGGSRVATEPQSAAIALVSFTSGFVFCVGLVALIICLPRRRGSQEGRPSGAGISVEPERSVEDFAIADRTPLEIRRRAATSAAAPSQAARTPDTVNPMEGKADKRNSLVEDFFASNVELFKECA